MKKRFPLLTGTSPLSLRALWNRFGRGKTRTPRQLRLCESLSLGERRFVALVECGRQRFLIGGTASSVALLSAIEAVRDREEKAGPGAADMARAGDRRNAA